jgi:hypothetical protein
MSDRRGHLTMIADAKFIAVDRDMIRAAPRLRPLRKRQSRWLSPSEIQGFEWRCELDHTRRP